jgi:superfamily II DNA or RNA helicase
MATANIVNICKSGQLLAVGDKNPEVCRLLEETLSYKRTTMVFEPRKKPRMVSTPFEVFFWKQDPDGFLPRRIFFPAGYLRRIAKRLREAGFEPRLRDYTPPPREGVFTPQWDRLADVRWRWMQKRCVERLATEPYMQLKCPPGYGKSFLIRCLAKLLPKARIVVTTPALDVLDQLHNDLSRHLPNVGLINSRRKSRGTRINCYSSGSLHLCEEAPDIIIADEVHELGTDHYFEKFATGPFSLSRHLGFSANAEDRSDGAWFELEGFFGPVLINLGYQACVEHGAVVPISVHWRDVVMDRDPAAELQNRTAKLRHGIWRNRHRNELIAADGRSFDDQQVLITVDVIEHAIELKKLLPEFELCYSEAGLSADEHAALAAQGVLSEEMMSRERRGSLKTNFSSGKLRKAIATTVWKRGVDFKGLGVLIRADAGASLISDTQIPGRTSRLDPTTGKEASLIVDYLDQFGQYFRERAGVRRRNYASHGWSQIMPGSSTPRQRSLL